MSDQQKQYGRGPIMEALPELKNRNEQFWDRRAVRDMRTRADNLEARAQRLRAEADEIERRLVGD